MSIFVTYRRNTPKIDTKLRSSAVYHNHIWIKEEEWKKVSVYTLLRALISRSGICIILKLSNSSSFSDI